MAAIIPDSVKRLIETWRLGFIATADADGTPNLSPKGTFAVLDEGRIGFAEMRSPRTAANIAVRPDVEVNFVDILTRKGARLRGKAKMVPLADAQFAELLPHFAPHWPDLVDAFNGIVVIDIESCRPLASPAYEFGAQESELVALWQQKIATVAAGGTP